jgi:protocatechuate 3,4-dioxygenase beta subunit
MIRPLRRAHLNEDAWRIRNVFPTSTGAWWRGRASAGTVLAMQPAPADSARPSRREITKLAVAFPLLSALLRASQDAADEPRFVAPPGELAGELREQLAALVADLEARRKTTQDVLADPASEALRPYTAFRDAIADHAPTGKTLLVPRGEPGEPLRVEARVLAEGKPVDGAMVYAYQTSARGWYAAAAPHVSGNSGDHKHARLFGYCRTDAQGRFELATVRPAGYPRSDLPAHIHLAIEGAGHERVTEIRFSDDPRLTPAQLEDSRRARFEIVTPERLGDGSWRCAVEFALP